MTSGSRQFLQLCGFFAATAALAAPTGSVEKIAIGGSHACWLVAGELKCLGDNEFGKATPPSGLKNVKDVAATYEETCVIDDEGVKCWGKYSAKPYTLIAGIKDPKAIALAVLEACAIDGEEVKCWELEQPGKLVTLSDVRQPKALGMGDEKYCVVDVEGVKCWGYGWENRTRAPKDLVNPRSVSASNSLTACAVGDNGIRCIGEYEPAFPPADLLNPRGVSIGDFHACTIEDTGLRCWGGNVVAPEFKHPRQVAVRDGTCVLHEDGFTCFGEKFPGNPTLTKSR